MKRSTERILTTHVGSLVRPAAILEAVLTKVAGRDRDEAAFERLLTDGVTEVVRAQAEIGIDIPSDGEFSKPNFFSYVTERLDGLRVTTDAQPPSAMNYPILVHEYPGFMAQYNG